MKNKLLQVLLVCACGGFLGVIAGKQFSNPLLSYVIGMPLGGIVACLCLPEVRNTFIHLIRNRDEIQWRKVLRVFLQNTLRYLSLISIIVFGAIALTSVFMEINTGKKPLETFGFWSIYLLSIPVSVLIAVLTGIFLQVTSEKSEEKSMKVFLEDYSFERTMKNKTVLLFANPITVPVGIITIGLYACAIFCLLMFYMIGLVLWNLVKAIHISRATTIFIDAAIGSGIGIYFDYNPLIGALAGSILGFVDYYLYSIIRPGLEKKLEGIF